MLTHFAAENPIWDSELRSQAEVTRGGLKEKNSRSATDTWPAPLFHHFKAKL